jgi:hypothetical protein
MSDSGCWEAIWPPEITDDDQLVLQCTDVLRKHQGLQHRAWILMSSKKQLGVYPDLTLLEEVYEKSGAMVRPFIDEVVKGFFSNVDRQAIDSDGIESVLLDPDCDPQDQAMEVYKGCLWELTAILASCIIHIKTGKSLHASCYSPIERASYIKTYSSMCLETD